MPPSWGPRLGRGSGSRPPTPMGTPISPIRGADFLEEAKACLVFEVGGCPHPTGGPPAPKASSSPPPGWWFDACGLSNLNGIYYPAGRHLRKLNGIRWHYFQGPSYSLRATRMMVRPIGT